MLRVREQPYIKKELFVKMIICHCWECPFCHKKIFKKGEQYYIMFTCSKKNNRLIKSLRFVTRELMNSFLEDLPRKFFEYNVPIPQFCPLKNSSEKKTTNDEKASSKKRVVEQEKLF